MVLFCHSYSNCTSQLRPLDTELLLSIPSVCAAVFAGTFVQTASERQLSQLQKLYVRNKNNRRLI